MQTFCGGKISDEYVATKGDHTSTKEFHFDSSFPTGVDFVAGFADVDGKHAKFQMWDTGNVLVSNPFRQSE